MPPPFACLTLSETAEANYAAGAAGRIDWDIPSWCGIFALAVYRASGLKMSSWPLKIKGFTSKKPPELRSVVRAEDLKRGDLGICDFRKDHENHHFLVVDKQGDSLTTIEGNVPLFTSTAIVQTIVRRNKYRVSQILQDPFSGFLSPIWANVLSS
jgi:hypothetical protein